MTSPVREVAWREIVTRSRTKSFRAITGILVLVAIIVPVALALWPDGDDDLRTVTVGLVDVEQATQQVILAFAEGNLDIEFQEYSGSSNEVVSEAVAEGDIDVAVEPGPTIVWNKDVDFEIAVVLNNAFQQEDVLARGRGLGLDEQDVAGLFTPLVVEERFVEGTDETDDVASVVALIGLMAAFLLPQAFGQLTLLSVVEEKSTRVVEVLLSHLRPRTLLLGKVIGLGVLAVIQLVVVVGGGIAALLLTSTFEIPASVWRFIPILVISVLGGLAIYNTLFALLGSLISRQEDAAQVMMPTLVPLMAGYIVGQSAIFGDADTGIAKVLTLFPLTAPMMLPIRVARDAIEWWEVTLSLGLLVLAVLLLIRVAGRVYEFTLLHTGARVGWRELIRMSRGALD